jgi:hypothetical protein
MTSIDTLILQQISGISDLQHAWFSRKIRRVRLAICKTQFIEYILAIKARLNDTGTIIKSLFPVKIIIGYHKFTASSWLFIATV